MVFGNQGQVPQQVQAGPGMAPAQQMQGQHNPIKTLADQVYMQQQQINALMQAMTDLQARQLAMTIQVVRGDDGRIQGAKVFEQRV